MTQSDGTPIAVDFAPDSRKFAPECWPPAMAS